MTPERSELRVPVAHHVGLILLFTTALFLAVAVGARPAAADEHRKQVTLSVEGMVCPLCENTVESVLTGLDGVDDARADRSTESAVVVYDPRDVSPDALADSINEETYYKASLTTALSDAPPSSPSEGLPAYLWFVAAAVAFFGWFMRQRVRTAEKKRDPLASTEEK